MGRKIKMKSEGVCPHCIRPMKLENGEESDGESVFYWECICGRSYDLEGKDITVYSCTNIS